MNVHGRYIILERLKHMHKQQTVFVSVFTCKVLCFAETGSIRDGEARLSVMLTNVIKIAHLVFRTKSSSAVVLQQSISRVKQMSKRV